MEASEVRRDGLEVELMLIEDATERALKSAHINALALCDELQVLTETLRGEGQWAEVHEVGQAWGAAITTMCEIGRVHRSYLS